MTEVTRVLAAMANGDSGAADQLLPLVYDELRKLAASRMAAERPDHTLDATALVHEAYVRLIGEQRFDNRGHFFAACAEAMRRILVESARAKAREKRGGGRQREQADLDSLIANGTDEELLALHDAMEQLAVHDPLKAKLVELRFFAGLTQEHAAECLNISPSTADRAWRYARAWLYTAMSGVNSKKS